MKRWTAFGILAGSVFVLSGSCQGPDAFYRPLGSGQGGRGLGGIGVGGFIGVGVGGRGTGGTIVAGTGGRQGTGGTAGAGGRGTGGTTGTAGTTGVDGGNGVGGSLGAGGRIVDAGSGCVATLINNGYAAGAVMPCSQCRENQLSRAELCMKIIDCIAPLYPCPGNGCFTECSNREGGSGPVNRCVSDLVAAACGP
ncbi:MAG TPA: hypothetical protein VFH68_09680 [Polyangia bacterium]|jgi:hypothetical protein|nr:hypothetical protein [Polyangia bacterium]